MAKTKAAFAAPEDVDRLAKDAGARLGSEWGVACEPQQTRDVARFVGLLLEWNERINLTGAADARALFEEHLPDSFALASRFAEPTTPVQVVDVGSGGGLPAIPLAILRPELRVDLVEPISKKVAFLRTAARELGLGPRARVFSVRVEGLVETHAGRYDAAMSRATFSPEVWLRVGRGLVRPSGRVFGLAAPADVPNGIVPVRSYAGGRRALLEVVVAAESSAR